MSESPTFDEQYREAVKRWAQFVADLHEDAATHAPLPRPGNARLRVEGESYNVPEEPMTAKVFKL
jgi:hypothetical protein